MNARASFPPADARTFYADSLEDEAIARLTRPEGIEQSPQPDTPAQLSPQVEAATRWLDRITIALIGVIAVLVVLLIHAQFRS